MASAQDEPLGYSIKQLIDMPRGAITVASAVLSLAAMLPFVYIEVRWQAVCLLYIVLDHAGPNAVLMYSHCMLSLTKKLGGQRCMPLAPAMDRWVLRRKVVALLAGCAPWLCTASGTGLPSGTRWTCWHTSSRLLSQSCTSARMHLDSLLLSVLLAAQILLLFWKVSACQITVVCTSLLVGSLKCQICRLLSLSLNPNSAKAASAPPGLR